MRFERLASISNGHIYNLRKTRQYRTGRLTFRKTRPTPVSIGVRHKPRPDGQPGFLRVDTVHLGDHGGRVRGWRGALRVRGVLRTLSRRCIVRLP